MTLISEDQIENSGILPNRYPIDLSQVHIMGLVSNVRKKILPAITERFLRS